MNDLNKTLEDRKSVYGEYSKLVELRTTIISGIKEQYFEHNKKVMPETDILCITDIVNKLCRLAVTPSHIDTWHDIAGYGTIIEKYYKEQEDAHKQ
jgi:hypothetical protein